MEEIGRRLRAAREAKGLTLENAEDETRIRRKYLEALEGGLEAELPGEAYLKGFLRTYGNYLGLDGALLVEEYKAAKGKPSDVATRSVERVAAAKQQAVSERVARVGKLAEKIEKPAEPAPAQAPVKTAAKVPTRTPVAPSPGGVRRKPQGSWFYSKQAGQALLALVVVALLGYGGYAFFGRGAKTPPPPTPPATVQPKPPETAPAPPPTATPQPVKTTMARGDGDVWNFSVGAKALDIRLEVGSSRVWMRAFVDGKQASEETVPADTARDFKGGTIQLVLGHMEGVHLVINGQPWDQTLPKAGTYTLNFKGE